MSIKDDIRKATLSAAQVNKLVFYNDGKYDTPRRYFDLDGKKWALAMGCPSKDCLERELVKEKRAYKIFRNEKPDILGIRYWWVYVER